MKSRFLFSIFWFNGSGIELQLFFNANDKAFFIAILAGLIVDSVYSLDWTGLLGLYGYALCMASIDCKPIHTCIQFYVV